MSKMHRQKSKIEILNLALIFAMSFLVLFPHQTGVFSTAR